MSNIAIKAENISKYYRLGQINNGTLYQDIQSWFARKMGKEDPHSKIGFDSTQSDAEGFWALKDINFEIKQGDRVGIIGRNGAGKSTLLKVISEITTPTAGNIYIKGRIASLLEVGTGFHPEMTGRENIYMNGAILGMKRAEITRQLDEIIDFAEIEKYIDTPVKRYSSGMYVRLAFAVAAHLQSEILIADEVLAVGDAAFQKKAIGKMSDLSTGEGRTVLFVSHNMGQIKALCKKGILLDKGKMLRQDSIGPVISLYENMIPGFDNLNNKKVEIDYPIDDDAVFQILQMKVVDVDGNIYDKYESFEDIYIEIKVLVRKTINTNYSYFALYNSGKQAMIVSDSLEVGYNIFGSLPVGESVLRLKIPAHTLGCGLYTVYLNFTSGNSEYERLIKSPGYACCFEVDDTISQRGKGRGALTGIIPYWELK